MAGEDLWFNGMFSGPVSGGGEDNNGGCFGDPNIPFSGFSLPVSGLQSSASGFSTSFSREPNNFGSFFDPSNSSSSSSSVSGVANQEVGFKKTKLAYSSYQSTGHHPIFQEGEGSMTENRQPLGLTLRKTNSFVNLLDQRLAKKKRISTELNQRTDQLNQHRIQPKTDGFVPSPSSEKLKATNFPILLLQIGSWAYESKHEGQLVAKCYYSKKKLVWEILDGSLKKKMEIQWSDISALGTDCIYNDPVILKIELKTPPQFFGETNPQPRKHTIWQNINDFTGGQASNIRRHYLRFPGGVLGKHYEKLLQCDQHLYILSTQPFPSCSSIFFPLCNRNDLDFRKENVQPPTAIWDSTSPISVMEFSSIDETGHKHGAEKPPMKRGLSMVTGNTVKGFPEGGEVQKMPYVVPAIQANQGFGYHMPNLISNSLEERTMLARLFSMDLLVQSQQQQQQVLAEDGNRAEVLEYKKKKKHLLESDIGTELDMSNEHFLLLLEQQQQATSELLPNSHFRSQTMNMGFDQELFPMAVTENHQQQQPNNFQTAHSQLAGENQMMQFEGHNNLIASHFLNDDELMQDNGNSSGSSYPTNFPDIKGEDFDHLYWGNQYG